MLEKGIATAVMNLSGRMGSIICSFDETSSKIIQVSEGITSLTGYSESELIEQPITLIHFPADFNEMAKKTQQLIISKKGFNHIISLRHKTGKAIPVQLTLEPVLNEQGDIIFVLGIANDMSFMGKASKELEYSEQKFRTLFERSSDALLILDQNVFTDYNPSALKMLGATREQMAILSPWELSPEYQPDGQNSKSKAIQMIEDVERKGSHRFEWIHKRIDGTLFPVEVILTPVSIGDKSVLYTVWRDIHQRKEAEHLLRETEEKFRLITENSLDMIWIRNMDLQLTYLSPAVEKVKGYSVEEGMVLSHEDFMRPTEVSLLAQMFKEQLEIEALSDSDPNRTLRYNAEELCADGSWIWTESIMSFIRNDNGEPIGILGITRDISDQKKLEDQLRSAKERAEESDRLKSAFVANMSHEIRTPMNSILGFSELLSDSQIDERNRLMYINIIQSSSNQLLSIISDIIDISKIEAHQLELHPEKLDLDIIFRELFEQYTLIIKESQSVDLTFSRICDGSSCQTKLYLDPFRFRQILINFLNNAIKFTPQGEISFGCRHKGPGFIEFFVKDTGIGIPKEQTERIFDRFYQFKDQTKVTGGTGLGLSICKSLVELMGGQIGVNSKVSEGSEFWFSLPINSKQ